MQVSERAARSEKEDGNDNERETPTKTQDIGFRRRVCVLV